MTHASHGQRSKRRVATIACLALFAAVNLHAAPVSVIGATLRATNPSGPGMVNVQATFLGDQQSLYTNELYLDAPTFIGPVFNSKVTPVNTTASLGSHLPETALFIRNQAYYIPNPGGPASYNFGFFTGTGLLPLNPDSLPHAVFTFDPDVPDGPVTVSFEDQFGGGDLDFNDAVYSFTNVRAGLVETALIPNLNPAGSTIEVQDSEERFAAGLEGSFTNEGTISNAGGVFNYGEFGNAGEFINVNAFFNDLDGRLTNSAGGTIDNQGDMGSFGTLVNDAGATIDNSGGMTIAGQFSSFGTVRNTGQMLFKAMGTTNMSIGGMLENLTSGGIVNDTTLLLTGEMSNAGTIQNNSTGTLVYGAFGDIDIGGRIENLGDMTIDVNAVLNNAGMIENSGSVAQEDGSQLNQALSGAIENLGQWTVGFGAIVDGSGSYIQSDDSASTVVNGKLKAGAVDILDGVVSGTGVIEGAFSVGPDGTVAPGESPGTLTVHGDFVLDGGTLEIELASLALHDVLDITGGAVFEGGTVLFEFDPAFTPAIGDRFVFLRTTNGITGFDTLAFSVSGPVGGLDFLTEVVGNDLVISAVPLPGTLGLLVPGLVAIAMRAKRRPARRRVD
jgi:hypothetical protein